MRYKIKAKAYLLGTNEGGRDGYIVSGYRPNFVFKDLMNKYSLFNIDGEIYFNSVDSKIYPGTTFICDIYLRDTDNIDLLIDDDKKFLFREGLKKVGEGEILEIVESDKVAINK
jgi:translation elongation factor EF-Tu-like GTPase